MAMKNVKVINSETVEHKGKIYTKVGTGEQAKKGDIIQRTNRRIDWLTKSAFYKVKLVDSEEIVQVKDDEGDLVLFRRDNGVLFRKISKPKAPVLTKAEKEIELEGTKYRKVEREAQTEYVPQEGDIVAVISNEYGSCNSVGDIGKIGEVDCVDGDARVFVPSGPKSANWSRFEEVRKATPAEVEEYKKALHKASFSVGDYVKSVKSEFGREEQILKITDSGKGLRTRHASGEVVTADFLGKSLEGNIYGILAERIVKATEHEVENALEAAKWAKIGRKVDEYKVGDIIEITEDQWGDKVGAYVKVTLVMDDGKFLHYASQKSLVGTYAANYRSIKLVAPVEVTFK